MRIWVRILALLIVASTPAGAQWYSWESDGTLHVTNQLAGGPPADELNRLPFHDQRSTAQPPVAVEGRSLETAPPAAASPPVDQQRLALQRHESRLTDRIAYLERLRAAPAPRTNEQLRMENVVEREIDRESAIVESLRRRLAASETR